MRPLNKDISHNRSTRKEDNQDTMCVFLDTQCDKKRTKANASSHDRVKVNNSSNSNTGLLHLSSNMVHLLNSSNTATNLPTQLVDLLRVDSSSASLHQVVVM